MYYLDTNTCIYFLNGKFESIKSKILSIPPNEIVIPSIVKAELLFGAYKSLKRISNIEKVEMFLEPFEIVAFDDPVTCVYADLREKMEKTGKIVGPNDLLIASIVRFYDGILVTNNEQEFCQIEELRIENWAR
ncbi:MAG: type II toxin-antitoxin system VapC family toxin [Treponema sp.]|jgi:tRNA(fMet)-specific endonuclease VapC|nr:type II toxin-antitoxin system VapC family toxin [Treponema sp.]